MIFSMGLSCMHWAVLNWEDVNILRSSLKHLLGNFCNWVWGGDGHSMVRLSLLSLPATAKECETAWCWPQLTPVLLSHLSTGPHTAYAHLFTSLPFYLETWSLNVLRVEIQSINVLIIDHDLHHAGCSVTPNLICPGGMSRSQISPGNWVDRILKRDWRSLMSHGGRLMKR